MELKRKKSSSKESSLEESMVNNISWKIIDRYFTDNPNNLVKHHLDSFNDFFENGIFNIFRENNPLKFVNENSKINIYLGGKEGELIYIGKPTIFDETSSERSKHYMYPNDARLRNMTYSVSIHYDIFIEYFVNNEIIHTDTKLGIYLGRFPIMLQSKLCILNGLPPTVRYNMGECRNDYGGYFIIDGKEKSIIPQEKFADNMIYIKKNKEDNDYSYAADIRSVSEDSSKPIRTFSIRIVAPSSKYTNNQIVVSIPNVKKPVPLFILMRALGVLSDKDIIQHCLLDMEKNSSYIDLFIPSVHDAGKIFTQNAALEYISVLTKRKTTNGVLYILMDMLLTHLGENNFIDKAYFIGYMVFKLLKVFIGVNKATDRDNYKFKRIELTGELLSDLFREYYLIQNKAIVLKIENEFHYHKGEYREGNIVQLIEKNYVNFFKERIVETGFRKAFKGNWGAQTHTKRLGIAQDLNRLSYFTFISQLRKIVLPLDTTSKVVGPRLLNSSQWGYLDPIDTPDGANIGLHNHLSITSFITIKIPNKRLIEWIFVNYKSIFSLQECTFDMLSNGTKIFVNGKWIGIINESPISFIQKFKLYRRNGILPIYISITFDYENNEIAIFSDAGRLMRPIYYIEDGIPSFRKDVDWNEISWNQIITGFIPKNEKYNFFKFYELGESYSEEILVTNKNIVDYIDTSEEECLLIANSINELSKKNFYTNIEILPSLLLGVMGNMIIFPSNNPVTRNAFSCGQSKQAISLFNTNYQVRMDKMSVVLNNGQIPLVKSKYLKYVNNEEQPYGVNTIVAIMSFSGYNVEDAILINEGSVKRGLFSTTYYTTYESREESDRVGLSETTSVFADVMNSNSNIKGIRPEYDYSYIDESGLVKENTELNERIVVIGRYTYSSENPDVKFDSSIYTKKGQLGIVDKSIITEGEEGFRIAKVRIREERTPAIGDKMASRAGQKGTIGLIIPEEDMPFTKDGIRPDIIINPHALPSRMTIGQLVETILGKVCLSYGEFGDCTAFENKGQHTEIYGKYLVNAGFHSSGNEILYNGYTGEQLYSNIYIGPTYYMRLKHMVKDKINYRARGPNNNLTRQPVQGRANDGGLRIGEMERDGLLAHGASGFLNESFMIRGDEYYMAVCNKTGCIAIYNKSLNLFLSPFADGPITFSKSKMTDKEDNILNIDNISRYGRSFSILRIPYSFKLLIQELEVMNIQMKIITEDNIDQLLSMSYSNNIQLLLQNETEDIKTLINSYKYKLTNMCRNPNNKQSKFIPSQSLNDMIQHDMTRKFIKSYDEAVSVGTRCLEYIKKNVGNSNPFQDDIFISHNLNPLITKVSTRRELFSMNVSSLENTMKYIFEILHHTCYFLCVYGGDKKHCLYKLVSETTSPIISKEFNKSFSKKVENNPNVKNPEVHLKKEQIDDINHLLQSRYRVMNCILKKSVSDDNKDFSREYETFFNNETMLLPSGIYILNLNDSFIIDKDYNFPWNVFKKPTPLSRFGISPKFIPVFSISGHVNYLDIPLPNYDDIKLYLANNRFYAWKQKYPNAIFRGGPTGCGYTISTNQRLKLAYMCQNPPSESFDMLLKNVNVGIVNPAEPDGGISINTKSIKNDPVYGIGVMNTDITSVDFVNLEGQAKNMFIIHIDGNVNAYRLLTSFTTGSLVLRVKSPFTSWFEHLIEPYDYTQHLVKEEKGRDVVKGNYISINEDLSNFEEVIRWCIKNEDICEQIAFNSLQLSKKLSKYEFIIDYTEMVFWTTVENKLIPYNKDSTSQSFPSFKEDSDSDRKEDSRRYYYEPTTPDFPPPPDYEPTTPDGPPPDDYEPTTPDFPPPDDYEPTTPDFPPPGYYEPRSPDGPPPGYYEPRSPSYSPPSTPRQYSPQRSPSYSPPSLGQSQARIYVPQTPPTPPIQEQLNSIVNAVNKIEKKIESREEGEVTDDEEMAGGNILQIDEIESTNVIKKVNSDSEVKQIKL
jgi:DNA-directed RNA polymerase II subunit RPB2